MRNSFATLVGTFALVGAVPLTAAVPAKPVPAPAATTPAPPTSAQPDSSTATDEATTPAPSATATAATTAKSPVPGETVYDNAGVPVGQIESVAGGNFVLATAVGKATVPLTGLGTGPKGHSVAMSKSDLENAVRQASAASAAHKAS